MPTRCLGSSTTPGYRGPVFARLLISLNGAVSPKCKSKPAIHLIAPIGPPKRPTGHGPDFNESEPESRQCRDRDGLDIGPAPESDWRRELQALKGSRQPQVGAMCPGNRSRTGRRVTPQGLPSL